MKKNLTTLKKEMKSGDNTVIAEKVGCSQEHVSRVLAGKQPSDTKTGRKIIDVAIKLIESREAIKAKQISDEEYQDWLISK